MKSASQTVSAIVLGMSRDQGEHLIVGDIFFFSFIQYIYLE